MWLGLQPSVLGSVDVKGLHKNASCEISGWNSQFVNRPHQPVMSIAVPFRQGGLLPTARVGVFMKRKARYLRHRKSSGNLFAR